MTQPSNPPQTSKPNQRRAKRLPAKGSTKVRCYKNALGLGPNIAATVLDLSETGVRLLLKVEATIGQEIEVSVEGVVSGVHKRVAVVVWSVPAADGRFCIGAAFQKALPYAAMSNLTRQ